MHTPKPPAPLFAGAQLHELLQDRQAAAVAATGGLTLADYAGEGEPAAAIADAHDLPDAPVVAWDDPRTIVDSNANQRMHARTEWPIEGSPHPLTWRPTRRWITTPPAIVGMTTSRIVVVIEAHHITPQDVVSGHAHARRYVDAHLAAIADELAAWRIEMRRQVRAAAAARRRLLDDVAALDASSALEALAH